MMTRYPSIQDHIDTLLADAEPSKPYATFAYDQPDFVGGSFPIYTIHGGPSDGSSVTAETLREMGIAVPGEKP